MVLTGSTPSLTPANSVRGTLYLIRYVLVNSRVQRRRDSMPKKLREEKSIESREEI